MEDQTVSVDELAGILNLTARRVQQLAAEGVLLKGEQHGRYPVAANVRRYVTHLEARRDPAAQEINTRKAKLLDIELAKRDGRLVELDEALHVVEQLTGSFVAALGGLPAQITQAVVTGDQRAHSKIRRQIEDILDGVRFRLLDDIAGIESSLGSDVVK